MNKEEIQVTRREFVKKAAYVPPLILTLAAAPAFAKSGSGKEQKEPEEKVKEIPQENLPKEKELEPGEPPEKKAKKEGEEELPKKEIPAAEKEEPTKEKEA